MLGRDLIMYILQNNLENEPIFKDGSLLGMITADEAAIKLHVGLATIKAMYKLGHLDGVEINGNLYVVDNGDISLGKEA